MSQNSASSTTSGTVISRSVHSFRIVGIESEEDRLRIGEAERAGVVHCPHRRRVRAGQQDPHSRASRSGRSSLTDEHGHDAA